MAFSYSVAQELKIEAAVLLQRWWRSGFFSITLTTICAESFVISTPISSPRPSNLVIGSHGMPSIPDFPDLRTYGASNYDKDSSERNIVGGTGNDSMQQHIVEGEGKNSMEQNVVVGKHNDSIEQNIVDGVVSQMLDRMLRRQELQFESRMDDSRQRLRSEFGLPPAQGLSVSDER